MTRKNNKPKFKSLGCWQLDNTKVWIVKVAPDDFSIFDGVGYWDVSTQTKELCEIALRDAGYHRVFKINKVIQKLDRTN